MYWQNLCWLHLLNRAQFSFGHCDNKCQRLKCCLLQSTQFAVMDLTPTRSQHQSHVLALVAGYLHFLGDESPLFWPQLYGRLAFRSVRPHRLNFCRFRVIIT